MLPTGSAVAEFSESTCSNCAVQAPTRWVVFHQNIGMLFSRRRSEVSDHLCRRCIFAYFRSYTLTTLFLGWWGTISVFITPLILLNNIGRFAASLTLSSPPHVTAIPDFQIDQKPIVSGAGNLKFKLIYGAVVWSVVLAVIAYHSVDFMEKHAPSLNAKLHGGEITEQSDADYAWRKIVEDLRVINADVKGTDWPARRADFLSRELYAEDFNVQSEKLRAAIAKDSASGSQDACSRLVSDQLVPALRDYSSVTQQLFAAIKSAPQETPESTNAIKGIEEQRDGAGERLTEAFSKLNTMKCEK